MKIPRPQIRLRGILLATLWMAVCFVCYGTINRAHEEGTSLPSEAVLTWIMMIAPFIAVGALFGRAILGAVIGTAAVAVFWSTWNLT